MQGAEKHEIQVRAQAHRLIRHMVERNAGSGGAPALCTHDELMHAVWADEPMHTREELAKLVWELRKKLEPFDAAHLIEKIDNQVSTRPTHNITLSTENTQAPVQPYSSVVYNA